MISIPFKRGDTFRLSCVYKIDGTGTELPSLIRSQLRDFRDNLIAELDVTIVDAESGQFTLEHSDTQDWIPGTLYGDIQYTDSSSNVMSTDTFSLAVVADQTHD